MTLVDYVKYSLKPVSDKPNNYARNASYDAALLVDTIGYVPDVVRARNGHSYVYFEYLDAEAFYLVRKMGFKPFLHKSHRYFPATFIFRARIDQDMPRVTRDVANKIMGISINEVARYTENPEYLKYISKYNIKTK